MLTYAIGDIQGCYDPFRRLLDRVRFDPARDRLWLVGDLVNRGPHSLETLRHVKSLGAAALTVLGNHDLYLLMRASGAVGRIGADETLEAVLNAPDRDELLDWLRRQPLCHVEGKYCLVHAGLLPQWDVFKARALAREVEAWLSGDDFARIFENMPGNHPADWDEALSGWNRLRVIVNAMTRLRFCTPEGRMDFRAKGEPKDAPPGFLPWFDVAGRASADHTIVCGHWSALGLLLRPGLIALDTGCFWGRELSAVRLEDGELFQVS
ncbi:MAG: symmetrical bis(5'-nucleosyl)-tetraphosphatase [Betaproteobacteria bacterium]|nr:symmetrical bis(5'-nucleosyl)-tetraphosphatase [Betaproteobacteria bacterium]